jgi:hypothetical protein
MSLQTLLQVAASKRLRGRDCNDDKRHATAADLLQIQKHGRITARGRRVVRIFAHHFNIEGTKLELVAVPVKRDV